MIGYKIREAGNKSKDFNDSFAFSGVEKFVFSFDLSNLLEGVIVLCQTTNQFEWFRIAWLER